MAVAALKQKPAPALKTFHATMLVTRAEEWCIEAETAEEARELLAAATWVNACNSRSSGWKTDAEGCLTRAPRFTRALFESQRNPSDARDSFQLEGHSSSSDVLPASFPNSTASSRVRVHGQHRFREIHRSRREADCELGRAPDSQGR